MVGEVEEVGEGDRSTWIHRHIIKGLGMGDRLEIAKFSLRACRCPRLTSYVVRCHRSCSDGASRHSSMAVCGSRGFAGRP